jgi:hypothetical protein
MANQKPEKPEDAGYAYTSTKPSTVTAGKQPSKSEDQPGSLNERHLAKAQMLSDSLFQRRGELHKSMGEPFKSGQLSATERKAQYKEMIASQELLMKALSGAAIVGRDGRLRISNKMVDAFVELSDA